MPESVETPAPVSTATRRPASAVTASNTLSVAVASSSVTVVTRSPPRDRVYGSRFSGMLRASVRVGGVRIERVAAADDDRLADYRDLTDVALRRVLEPEGGLYMAESAKVIRRALAAGHRPRSFLVQEKWLTDVEELAERHPNA